MKKLRRPVTLAASGTALVLAGSALGAGVYSVSTSPRTTTVVRQAAPAATAVPTSQTQASALNVHQIYTRNAPGVVQITVTEQGQAGPYPFGGGSSQAQGSGFVYDSKGDIVTNEHVVAGATSIRVTFSDGSSYPAKLVGRDTSTDLAVVRVDAPASKLHPLTLGSSSGVQVGDGVVAIGSPFGLAESVTSGIVSALHRQISAPDNFPIADAIQTDAAINHGNSGGVLLDLQGRVIGVTAQIESNSGGSDGVGFAIPSDSVRSVVDSLVSSGKVSHGYLGVAIGPGQNGVAVSSVRSGTAAARAGLRSGDVITAVDGTSVRTTNRLEALIAAKKPGDRVTLRVRRGGSERTVTLTLGARPS